MNLRTNFISEAFILILFGMCLKSSFSHPVSYSRDHAPGDPVLLTTTPKKVKDTFQLNKQVMPVPPESKKTQPLKSSLNGKTKYNDIPLGPVTYKVKAANPGEKLPRQNDEDDDDDDGGEYEGASDLVSCKKKSQDDQQERPKSMPMMIIRQFDVMAMDLPVANQNDCKKLLDEHHKHTQNNTVQTTTSDQLLEDSDSYNYTEEARKSTTDSDPCDPKDPAQKVPTIKNKSKDWGSWSPCSKSCGEGIQTRSRLAPTGYPNYDTQMRTCKVADCHPDSKMSGDPQQMRSPLYKLKDLSEH